MERKTINMFINNSSNHINITKNGSGASEFLFFITALKLSNYFNVNVYYCNCSKEIDNINYINFNFNNLDEIKNINNSIIIIQRFFYFGIEFHKLNNTNKYFIWSHDYIQNIELNHLYGNYNIDEISNYFNKNDIKVIGVSKFHKDNLKNVLNIQNDKNLLYIYNSLFDEYFIKNKNINYDKNKILFASASSKGLNKIINICENYYKINNNFRLILLTPNYTEKFIKKFNLENYNFILYKGVIKDKQEYSNIIQECLCVISASFRETFGCVYSESLHLGTPVIGDISIKSAITEIIDKEYLCNFNDINSVIELIEKIKNNRKNVFLKDCFYEKETIKKWVEILNEDYT